MSQLVEERPRLRRERRRQALIGFAFVLPVLLLFIVFRLTPTLGAVGMSVVDYRLSGIQGFVGIENYQRLVGDPVFWKAMRTTLLYAAIYVPIVLLVAFGAAILLDQVRRGEGFARGMLFLPYVTSYVLAGVIWKWLLSQNGLINGLLADLDIGPVPFLLGEQWLVLLSLVIVAVWKGFGYSMLILLAGLKGIPDELTEAAMVDGAGPVARFFRITLPLLRPVIFFVVVIETIAAFQVFDTAYTMTGGGPARASYSLVYLLYDTGFKYFNFGYAATMGVAIFLVILVISLVQRRLLEDKE